MLITAYGIVLKVGLNEMSSLFNLSIVLGIIGTLGFFYGGAGFLLAMIQRNQNIYLKKLNISFTTYVSSIGDIVSDPADFDADYISKNELNMPDAKSCEAASAYLSDIMAQNDSIGSTVKCIVSGVPAGLGDPVFD